MQEVGKKWQALTAEERQYFKMKADHDKVRYLQEQRAFYDEVEKIGKNVGTVTTKEGKVVVASTIAQPAPPELSKKAAKAAARLEAQTAGDPHSPTNGSAVLSKRKLGAASGSSATPGGQIVPDSPNKR